MPQNNEYEWELNQTFCIKQRRNVIGHIDQYLDTWLKDLASSRKFQYLVAIFALIFFFFYQSYKISQRLKKFGFAVPSATVLFN